MAVSSAQNQCDSSQAFNVCSVWSSQSPDAGPEIPSLSDLKRLLPESRARKFVAYTSVNSQITVRDSQGVTVKCWVFRRGGAVRSSDD